MNRAEIICSYLKINNKYDEFTISLINKGFNIKQNNQIIFTYCNILSDIFMEFYIQTSLIYSKMLNNNYQLDSIVTKKISKDYFRKVKHIYYNTIEFSNKSYIFYNFKKDSIVFHGYKTYLNRHIHVLHYRINIRYYNRFIYKSHDEYIYFIYHSKYTNYKICIPNKYELLYYSNYLLIYL
jgi:hypothetical protein